jgi:hypothetical protein
MYEFYLRQLLLISPLFKYLSSNAQIIHSSTFEKAIVEVLKGSEIDLTTLEKFSLINFDNNLNDTKSEKSDLFDVNNNLSFAEKALVNAKKTCLITKNYLDLSFVQLTSN